MASAAPLPSDDFDAVLPGAFNPLHDAHRAMRADAARRLGRPVGYELCIANVDKPRLDYLDLNPRLAQFARDEVVVTNTPTFVAKARALGGGIAFVVGVDTLVRIAAARYYGGAEARDAAFAELAAMGCTFLVYGRADDHGAFKTLAETTLPPALAACAKASPRRNSETTFPQHRCERRPRKSDSTTSLTRPSGRAVVVQIVN